MSKTRLSSDELMHYGVDYEALGKKYIEKIAK